MTCGALIAIAGLNHLGPFRCTQTKGHEGAHTISLGPSLLKRLQGTP